MCLKLTFSECSPNVFRMFSQCFHNVIVLHLSSLLYFIVFLLVPCSSGGCSQLGVCVCFQFPFTTGTVSGWMDRISPCIAVSRFLRPQVWDREDLGMSCLLNQTGDSLCQYVITRNSCSMLWIYCTKLYCLNLFSFLLFKAPVFDTDGPGLPVNHGENLPEDMTLPLCLFAAQCKPTSLSSLVQRCIHQSKQKQQFILDKFRQIPPRFVQFAPV